MEITTRTSPLLLPQPRQLKLGGDFFVLPDSGFITLDAPDVQALRFVGSQLQDALRPHGIAWEMAAGLAGPAAQTRAILSLVPGCVSHEQGYSLTITADRISAVASQPVGLFYAVQTLRQLIQHHGARLPVLRCTDWPDFPNRGVMLDISRDRVPTMETLYELIDMLASWKVNQVQLYTEHTFAYHNHPTVWAEASPVTGQEILALDDFCRQRFIELVPNQNTFGHMRRWLIHDPYRHLAEAPNGCMTRWGWFDQPYSLNPTDPASLDLVRGLLDELLPHFSSRQVNVGCDETVDLGQGRSREACDTLGEGRVYLDFVQKLYREVKARGHTMQFWGDIIMEHPDLAAELPRDAIALEWGYEADHPFDQHGAIFAASGAPFYVCAGTSSWRTLAGRTANALGNLRSAAAAGLKHGAIGYLNTDWGDEGHWQHLPISYLGFAYGAGQGWAATANAELDLPAVLDVYVFRDRAGVMGRLAFDLGNVYQTPGILVHNSSILFNILQTSPPGLRMLARPGDETDALLARLQTTLDQIDGITAPLGRADMQRPDADLIQREFDWTAGMLGHACRRAFWALDGSIAAPDLLAEADRLIAEYDALWRARCRPGGFKDSVARLIAMRGQYAA